MRHWSGSPLLGEPSGHLVFGSLEVMALGVRHSGWGGDPPPALSPPLRGRSGAAGRRALGTWRACLPVSPSQHPERGRPSPGFSARPVARAPVVAAASRTVQTAQGWRRPALPVGRARGPVSFARTSCNRAAGRSPLRPPPWAGGLLPACRRRSERRLLGGQRLRLSLRCPPGARKPAVTGYGFPGALPGRGLPSAPPAKPLAPRTAASTPPWGADLPLGIPGCCHTGRCTHTGSGSLDAAARSVWQRAGSRPVPESVAPLLPCPPVLGLQPLGAQSTLI